MPRTIISALLVLLIPTPTANHAITCTYTNTTLIFACAGVDILTVSVVSELYQWARVCCTVAEDGVQYMYIHVQAPADYTLLFPGVQSPIYRMSSLREELNG